MFKSKATLLIYFILKIEDHDEVPESNKEIKTFVRLMKKFQKQKIRFGYAVSRPIGTMSLKDLSTIQPERVSFHFDLQAVYIKHLISRICEIPDKGFSNITNLQFIITAPFSDIYNKLSDKYKYFNNLKILLISLKYMTREVHQPIIVDRERQGLFIKSLLKPIKSLQILKLERMPLNKLTNLNETLARYFPELKALYLTYYIKLPLPIDDDFFMPFRNLEAIFIQCPGKREWSFPKSLRMINLFCNRNPRLTTGSHWDQPQSCACFDSARPFNVFVDNGKRRGIQTRIFMEKLVDYELYLRCCEVFRMKNFE
uniref:F-box domain-containing protein n=1 Tax=Rhabditophanes sp. KR3021 TaxID=114890 RepID=A0AC35TWJ3_9BILA